MSFKGKYKLKLYTFIEIVDIMNNHAMYIRAYNYYPFTIINEIPALKKIYNYTMHIINDM
jgi:hypothetical protein